jgi:ABC-type branched-subunit amino acid transport system substrate-binding protein
MYKSLYVIENEGLKGKDLRSSAFDQMASTKKFTQRKLFEIQIRGQSMGYPRESRPATLMKCILVSSWCISFLLASADASNSATLGIDALDKEVIFGGYDVRELQTAYNQSVVNIAVLFDTANTFDWARQIIDFTFTLLNDHTDGWHDEIFPDGTIINYRISDPVCDETAAARAYWDLRNEWDGIVHGVVGPRCSGASIAVGRITNLDNVTQISPSSTSQKLGDKGDFPLFSRLVGPSSAEGEAGAMVAMLRSFGWDRITIFTMDTQYAKDYTTAFEELWKGTVAYSSTITFDDKGGVDANSVNKALEGVPTADPSKNSRVILLVADGSEAYPILQRAGEQGFQPDTIWVGPQSWVGRLPTNGTVFDMPTNPGYLGLTPFRNRDVEYQTYFERLKEMQRANGLDVMTELPDYTAEFLIDSILALVKALSSVPRYPSTLRRNGTLVTSKLRNLTFQGVSGNVSFTPEGDRLDPQYTIFNLQIVDGAPKWVEVGRAGTSSAEPKLDSICFAVTGCNLESFPSDQYPVPAKTVEVWVIAVITVMLVLLIAVGLKYEISRRKTLALKSSMSEIEKKMKAMQEIDDEIVDIDDKVEAAKRRQASLMQKRAALIEKPDTWSASAEILVEVLPHDPQYWEVYNRLHGDMSDAHISKLWRIQNNSFWTYYSFHRDRLEMTGVDHNEKSVWHGTSSVDPSAIYNDRQDGFMMQHSQSGLWG